MSACTSSVKTGRDRDAAASEQVDELKVYRGRTDARCTLTFGSSRSLFSRKMDLGFQGLASQRPARFSRLLTDPFLCLRAYVFDQSVEGEGQAGRLQSNMPRTLAIHKVNNTQLVNEPRKKTTRKTMKPQSYHSRSVKSGARIGMSKGVASADDTARGVSEVMILCKQRVW
jgi:hypothetical protein